MTELKVLYKVGEYLASEDLSTIYVYDNWCKTPAAAEFRKQGISGSRGSFGGRNICLGIDQQGNKIMSDGVWYVYEGGMTQEEKDFVISQIKKEKGITTTELKCPYCGEDLDTSDPPFVDCKNDYCHLSFLKYGSKELWQALIDTKKKLEKSKMCCTDWEKQALDYKAENIALSGELERTRKALDLTIDTKKKLDRYENALTFIRNINGAGLSYSEMCIDMREVAKKALNPKYTMVLLGRYSDEYLLSNLEQINKKDGE